ncbi:response regulator [Rhodanobacter sp. A1T4]|uniref:response regulator n=1 Tax=Rhodanobacter sp. A1T4 TaxID=2723087 RepID=UPI001618BDB3|nr:response regulator [Rhodanobacter sp. A1T4]MBB6249000.1 DNA-binding NarL/FixJ family response regulator [Rhodanobacter sp. A1T4]
MNSQLVVLIVEDHPVVLDSLKFFVESFPNVQILSADSFVSAAVWINATKRIDLLLCDVLLPGAMDGIDVAEAAVNTHSDIAVVLLSADPMDEIKGLTDRYSFLQKPFGRDAITQHIDSAFLRLRA